MDSIAVIIVLRIIHILSGVFWVGGTLQVAFFILPTVKIAGPAGGPFVGALMGKARLAPILVVGGVLSVASGVLLYWNFYAEAPWSTFGPHTLFGIGGVLAVIALIAGSAIGPPTSSRMAALGAQIAAQGTPPSPEQLAERGALMGRLTALARFNATVLILAAACMASARYVS
jgi:hypothetical protein